MAGERPLFESVLAGRQRELRLFQQQFEASIAGQLLVTLVAGEPGIGKTRFLREATQYAEQAGAVVLSGSASEAEGMPPYLPLLEALGQYIRSAPVEELQEQTGAMAPVLTTILPELSFRLRELPDSYSLPPEQARLRLYEAVGLFLAAIARTSGLLLVLDDLQWTDTSTLDLLCYVARTQPRARLLILGAYRSSEITHHPAFERTLTELHRLRLLTPITLGPLSEADMGLLALNLLRFSVDPLLLHRLVLQSEGNPFFAEELLRDGVEMGFLAKGAQGSQPEDVRERRLPSSIVGAIRSRVGRLDTQIGSLLQVASAIGRAFAVDLLAGVVGQDMEAVEERLQKALEAHLIRSNSPGVFTFSHDLIRAGLYDGLPLCQRTRLHTLIARRLALRLRSDQPATHQLAELAFHFSRSGDQEQSVVYSLLAAEEAKRTCASEVAIGHYRTALQHLSNHDPRKAESLLLLGEASLQIGAVQEAVEAFQAALTWWKNSGDRIAMGKAGLALGRAYWRLEEINPARATFEQAVSLLSSTPTVDTVWALVELGSLLLVSLHNYPEAQRYLERALDLARQFGEMRLKASASRAFGNALMRAGKLEEGIRLLEEALALADEAIDVMEAAECCECLFLAKCWAGQLDGWEDLLYRCLQYAQLCHDPYQLRHIYSHLATFHALRGDWAQTEEYLLQGQTLTEQQGLPEPLAMFQWTRGIVEALQGKLDTAFELIQASIARFRVLEPQSLVWWLGWLGIVQALQGKRKEALAVLEELETLILPLPAGSMAMVHVLSHMATIVVSLGESERAERLYTLLLPYHGQFHAILIDRLLGSLATLLKDFTAAQDYLRAAEVVARRFAFNVELAWTLEASGNLALAVDGFKNSEAGRSQLEEALELFTQLGDQIQAQRLRHQLRRRARKPAWSCLPLGLSEREVEVLRLVATGKSNRQISEMLVISERTVINHIASIFNKTGVNNRAGATAFAIRHKLVE
ncbi:helix-turn-helix transcriptional regulator [Ktedonobacter sp. SOSP1-85]|uniref:helix-turn-helix transcriptional regulator n=1 Tax=Ktedonobacter sp. SOSP1-85 TaxID=2778367 RepID=UPI001915805F|nr:helix-turn-helix transcriptional regulator [Ktedonobacter sp. SOSP1-85]